MEEEARLLASNPSDNEIVMNALMKEKAYFQSDDFNAAVRWYLDSDRTIAGFDYIKEYIRRPEDVDPTLKLRGFPVV